MAKKFYHSRVLWANLLSIVAIILQAEFGFVISPEEMAAIIAVINVLLRFWTKEGLEA